MKARVRCEDNNKLLFKKMNGGETE